MRVVDPCNLRLDGATVSLVPLSITHLPDLLRHAADPALWQWWIRKPPLDEATMRAEIELALTQQGRDERIPFAIVQRVSGEGIGSTSYLARDVRNRSVEIGATWLGSAFHGGHINRECKELLIAHAFANFAVKRVVLQTDALNLRSRRAIEKLGARLDGILREDKIVWDGRIRSSAVYSILHREWCVAASPSPA